MQLLEYDRSFGLSAADGGNLSIQTDPSNDTAIFLPFAPL